MNDIIRHITIPDDSFFLFGPRGTGKSTFVKTLIDRDVLYVDFLDPETFRTYSAFPETLIKTVDATKPVLVIVDEVQKVPSLLDVVHKIMEEKKIRFILTGSGARKLKKSGADLLGGRAAYCTMHRVLDDGRVLLSRAGAPMALLQLRPVKPGAPESMLSAEQAAKLCEAGAQSAPLAVSSEQLRELEFPALSGGGRQTLLLCARGSRNGARILFSSRLAAVAQNSPPATGTATELAVQIFPPAPGKRPNVLFVNGQREPPVFDKPIQRRARSWSFEGAGNFRVTLARSGPADWTVQSAGDLLLATAPLMSDPREPRQAGGFVLYLGAAADEGPPELSPVKLDKLETPSRDFVEGSLRVYASGANPFVLSETAVVAEIALPPKPNGDVPIKRLPCYFWEAPSHAPAEGEFRFRFAPPQEGIYGVRAVVVTAAGQARGDAISFRAGAPASAGFVKVRERALQNDDRSAFAPVGCDLSLADPKPGVEALRKAFITLGRQDANAARVSISISGLALEPAMGRIDADAAAKIDEVLRAAQVRGIRLFLSIEDAADISTRSAKHPYFREQNGPLAATPEFFRDPAAKRLFYNRLTYIAARYGAFRSVLAWELISNLDQAWPILQKNPDDLKLSSEEADLARRGRRDVQAWVSEMGLHLKGMDQHEHPVTVSLTLPPGKPWLELEKLEELSWVFHAFELKDGPDFKALSSAPAQTLQKWIAAAREPGRHAKPFLLSLRAPLDARVLRSALRAELGNGVDGVLLPTADFDGVLIRDGVQ